MANPLLELKALGQSVWYDNISRAALRGELAQLVAAGEVQGVTSNPTIFEKAIAGSTDYDEDIRRLVRAGRSTEDVFWELAVEDVRSAAELLRPVFEASGGLDGYVSLEVSPTLAADAQGTVAAAERLFRWVGRPNVMIKIPATRECWPAIEESIARGVNVNITMMFSPSHYEAVVEAYLRGLERRVAAGQDVRSLASVASVFVSRIDTLVDKRLEALAAERPERAAEARALLGRAAIANAREIYARFREVFSEGNPRWKALAARGARVQRPLWASTSTKNPKYRDVVYVEELIGPDTVNTMPPATIAAFRDHGVVRRTVDADPAGAQAVLQALRALGIDIEEVGATLQREGVQLFADSFAKLLHEVETKAKAVAAVGR